MTDSPIDLRVAASFASQGLMRHLGARLVEAVDGRCVIEVDAHDGLLQQHGYFHAGVTASIADTAAGFAAYTLMEEGSSVLTVEFKVNLMAPAAGEVLRAEATVLRAGRSVTTVEARVFALARGEPRECAAFLGTMFAYRGSAPELR